MEKAARRRGYGTGKGKRAFFAPREKRRLLQLGACAVLFMAVYLAKGQGKLETLRGELSQTLGVDADFQTAFARLGRSLSSGEPVGESLNTLWTEVFLPREPEPEVSAAPRPERVFTAYAPQDLLQDFVQGSPARGTGLEEAMARSHTGSAPSANPALPAATQEPEVTDMGYAGPPLPDNTTMDRYALGLAATADPVEGRITSAFGWRTHPVTGQTDNFHCGVDLKAPMGTPVLAFAAGVVDYIGEDDSYGQYIQLRHDNGVTSFYAHCSKLCAQPGQTVALGEKVAEAGATGEVTGPHLHFEMRKDGVRLNPAYYISNQP